jgi:competence protein ComEC
VSDFSAFMLAVAVCAGARLAVPVPRGVVLATVAVAVLMRRPLLVLVAALLLASALAFHSWSGLAPPESSSFDGVAVLAGDPSFFHGALHVDLRVEGRRVEAWARGAAADALHPRLTGELIRVRGRLRQVTTGARRRLAVRHVAARLDIVDVGSWRSGNLATRLTNGVRRTLTRGARSLPDDDRSLLLGVVLGDDRDQRQELTDDFRSSGLTHLLAVSGTNVAFVLALAGPLLRRMGLRGRWAATLSVLALFGLLTRWEPSVLRAGAMAAIACTATTLGRPTGRLRLLALAVCAVVLVDPMVVHALGFRLSVGATIGIALFGAPLARRLRGPSWLVEALAVTAAAQIGVAPVALPAFGGLPLASLPANVLAIPAAAPLTAWGLTGGLLAGVAGPPFDRWLHLPTRLLTWWLAAVARWAASLPLGQLRTGHAVLLAGMAAVWWSVGSGRWRRWRSDHIASTSPTEPS